MFYKNQCVSPGKFIGFARKLVSLSNKLKEHKNLKIVFQISNLKSDLIKFFCIKDTDTSARAR